MRRWMRVTLFAAGGVILILLAVIAAVLGPYMLRVRHFAAAPEAGYQADFYLYVSPGAERAAKGGEPAVILVQPNNTGRLSDDAGFTRRDAWLMGYGRKSLADQLGVVLLVPAFLRPADDWEVYTHALDRDVFTTSRPELARPDLQLLAMIDAARADLAARGLPTRERVLVQGFSASGMFANRFTALHPGRVLAAAVGSPGGWPIAPAVAGVESLAYPAGVADLEALTGAPFDAAGFAAVPQLFVMGDQDHNDGLDHRDGWEEETSAQVDRLFGDDPQTRWPRAESLYRKAGVDARFVLVPGVGHDRRRLQALSTDFLAQQLTGRSGRTSVTPATDD